MDALKEYRERIQPIYDIIGAAMESLKWYHEGVNERVYEVGMKEELLSKGYVVHKQHPMPVYYKGKQTDVNLRMDLVVETPYIGDIIVELKAVNRIEDEHRLQLWSYMRQLNNRYGLLINFSPKGVYSEKWEYDYTSNKCYRVSF